MPNSPYISNFGIKKIWDFNNQYFFPHQKPVQEKANFQDHSAVFL